MKGDTVRDKVYREKYWNEIDSAGKIERMREVVKRMENRVVNLEKTVGSLRSHDHMGNEIVCKLSQSFDATGMGIYREEHVYF